MAKEQELAGRVALVTGAANGMGLVMARALAAPAPRSRPSTSTAAASIRCAAKRDFPGIA